MQPSHSHADLCRLAVGWLQRPKSNNGPGCQVAVSEPRCGYLDGEIPDAIGFRCGVHDEYSTVVEAKVSRADFLADRHKPHRTDEVPGMGLYRYFMAPKGILRAEELPRGWGLIEVNEKGHIRVLAGHILEQCVQEDGKWVYKVERWQHHRNIERELSLLARLVMKIGDVDEAQRKLRDAYRAKNNLSARYDQLHKEYDAIKTDTVRARRVLANPAIEKLAIDLGLIQSDAVPLKAIPRQVAEAPWLEKLT